MVLRQVTIELGVPTHDEDELLATITYQPSQAGSTRIYLFQTDLDTEQLRIIGEFINRLTVFVDKAEELVKNIIEQK